LSPQKASWESVVAETLRLLPGETPSPHTEHAPLPAVAGRAAAPVE
jgi:hypothetical protein